MHKPVRHEVLFSIKLACTQGLEGQQHQCKQFQRPLLFCIMNDNLKWGQLLSAPTILPDSQIAPLRLQGFIRGVHNNEMYQSSLQRAWSLLLLQLNPGYFCEFWSKCHMCTVTEQYSLLEQHLALQCRNAGSERTLWSVFRGCWGQDLQGVAMLQTQFCYFQGHYNDTKVLQHQF